MQVIFKSVSGLSLCLLRQTDGAWNTSSCFGKRWAHLLSLFLKSYYFSFSRAIALPFLSPCLFMCSYPWYLSPKKILTAFFCILSISFAHIYGKYYRGRARTIASRPIRFGYWDNCWNLIGLEAIVRACPPSVVLSVSSCLCQNLSGNCARQWTNIQGFSWPDLCYLWTLRIYVTISYFGLLSSQ